MVYRLPEDGEVQSMHVRLNNRFIFVYARCSYAGLVHEKFRHNLQNAQFSNIS